MAFRRFFLLLTSQLLLHVNPGTASPLGSEHEYQLHEKRDATTAGAWKRSLRVESNAIIPLRIGLVQTNLDAGHQRLMEIADPFSPTFGKHFSADEVHEMFSPTFEAIEQVKEWLRLSGINDSDIVHSDNRGWLAMDLPAVQVERLLRSEIHEYEHHESGHTRLGCEEYHVPTHIAAHVDYITPGIKLTHNLRKRTGSGSGALPGGPHGPGRGSSPPDHGPLSLPPGAQDLPPNVQHCDVSMTPPCWRALYGLPRNTINSPNDSLGFFQQGDYWSQTDLNSYFQEYAPYVPQDTSPTVNLIDGAVAPVPVDDPHIFGEADLDISIGFALTYPTVPTVYQVDERHYALRQVAKDNLFNTFLDALDGSYCNYTAYGITGNNWKDPIYPDPAPHGYKGQLQCGVFKPTRVISASYGEGEGDIPVRYDRRQCNEWMKLALQGHTVIVASGDYGVAAPPVGGNGCIGPNSDVFNPPYVSGCPYVLSVGGTQLNPNQTVRDPETAMYTELDGTLFSSAGGFSNHFSRPSWQDNAVSTYFAKHDPGYLSYVANANATNIGAGGGRYNRAGRATPDVSANGANAPFFAGGQQYPFYGASLAAPIWASTITLINIQRSQAGKGPVGFISPTLYSHPWAMNDITNGSSAGCNTTGFKAVSGWDPVTGLGTPNYPKLLEVFMGLP